MGLLRSVFGPSKDEIWGQIARDIGGQYEDGGLLGRDIVRCESGEWELMLDTYTQGGEHSQTYTRMRAPFVNKDGLHFKIYREGFFSSIGKVLGMQDIQVGDPYFDDSFVIKGNDEKKIRRLFMDPKLKRFIKAQPDINFEIRDDDGWFGTHFPEGVDVLYFECNGVVKDEARLKNMFDLFTLTLERLVQIDSAYEKDPRVIL